MKPKAHTSSSGTDQARHPQSKRARVGAVGSSRASAFAATISTHASQHEEFAVGDYTKMPFMPQQLKRNMATYDSRCKRKGRKPVLLITDLPAGLRQQDRSREERRGTGLPPKTTEEEDREEEKSGVGDGVGTARRRKLSDQQPPTAQVGARAPCSVDMSKSFEDRDGKYDLQCFHCLKCPKERTNGYVYVAELMRQVWAVLACGSRISAVHSLDPLDADLVTLDCTDARRFFCHECFQAAHKRGSQPKPASCSTC